MPNPASEPVAQTFGVRHPQAAGWIALGISATVVAVAVFAVVGIGAIVGGVGIGVAAFKAVLVVKTLFVLHGSSTVATHGIWLDLGSSLYNEHLVPDGTPRWIQRRLGLAPPALTPTLPAANAVTATTSAGTADTDAAAPQMPQMPPMNLGKMMVPMLALCSD